MLQKQKEGISRREELLTIKRYWEVAKDGELTIKFGDVIVINDFDISNCNEVLGPKAS